MVRGSDYSARALGAMVCSWVTLPSSRKVSGCPTRMRLSAQSILSPGLALTRGLYLFPSPSPRPASALQGNLVSLTPSAWRRGRTQQVNTGGTDELEFTICICALPCCRTAAPADLAAGSSARPPLQRPQPQQLSQTSPQQGEVPSERASMGEAR